VNALHAAGATRVDVVVMHGGPRRIERDGGPDADRLMVYFTPFLCRDVFPSFLSLWSPMR